MNKNRIIENSGIDNFRQLGGYETTDGRHVKWDVLFRSGSLSNIGANGLSKLSSMGIKTVFDLRSTPEKNEAPDKVPENIEYIHYPGVSSMELDSANEMNGNLDIKAIISKSDLSHEQINYLRNYLVHAYEEMGTSPEAFSTVFKILLEKPGSPILFHCTAGKDRTGVCAAYILLALGVPMETVYEDYLLSNSVRSVEIDKLLHSLKSQIKTPELAEIIEQMFSVQPKYLDAAMKVIQENYGGFNRYCFEKLGLSADMLDTLRSVYLE